MANETSIARRTVLALPTVLLAASCTSDVETVPTPTAGVTADAVYSTNAMTQAMPMVSSGWWYALGSTELDALVARLITSNPDLAAASLRVLQSELELGNARAQRLPTVSASTATTGSSSTNITGDRSSDATGDLSATVRWEADLWGRIAREGDRAAALLLASV